MKKTLIALAVAGVVAAPAAFAATANVDIYGQMNLSVDHVNFDDNTTDEKAGRVNTNGSRIGFKGSEDLGGGLSAIFQAEYAITPDTNGGAIANRQQFVGLASKTMGTVRLGAIESPYKMATSRLDNFVDTMGDYNVIMGSYDGGANNFDVRSSNAVDYTSPSFSGLTLGLQYAANDEAAADATDANTWAASAQYVNGPLFASLAYEKQNDAGGANSDRKGMKLGAGYQFGDTRLGAAYERLSQTGTGAADRNAWFVSAAHSIGAITLKAQYARAGDSDVVGGDDGATSYSLGADYALSKRTVVTGMYGKVNNDTNGSYVLGGNGNSVSGALANGADASGLSLIVKHSF